MYCHYRIRPRDLEDDILSAFAHQLPSCIVHLLYFYCVANHLICCTLCDMKEEAGAKVKRENNLQGDRSFSDLQNMLFLVSSLPQLVKEQITVLDRFGVHICTTFWVEVNEVHIDFFLGRCCMQSILYLNNVPPCDFWPPAAKSCRRV